MQKSYMNKDETYKHTSQLQQSRPYFSKFSFVMEIYQQLQI